VATREAGFPPPGLGFGSIARAAGATTRRRRRSRRGAAAKNATPAGSAPERPRRTGRKTSHPLPFRCCRGPCTPSTPPNTTTTTKQHQTPTPPPNNNTNHRERDGNGQANDQTSKQARKPAQNHEDGRCGVARCGAGDREPHERAPNPRTERRRRARRHAHRSWVDRPDCRVRRRPTQEQTRRGAALGPPPIDPIRCGAIPRKGPTHRSGPIRSRRWYRWITRSPVRAQRARHGGVLDAGSIAASRSKQWETRTHIDNELTN